jgi:hypothetical protein
LFSGLSAGNYVLHARCIDSRGAVSKEIKFAFTIKQAFYKTWWFIGLIIILLIFVILLLNDKSQNKVDSSTETSQSSQSDNQTSSMYANMTGDQFDKAYLTDMIAHHQGALNMASHSSG